MRVLLLALLFLSGALATRGETVREWVNTAPKANITFTKWDGDLPSTDDNGNGATHLPQGFYGYLDLSQLPPDAFPIKLRLIYDTPFPDDISSSLSGQLSQLKDSAPTGSGLVVIETIYSTASDVRAVPVWNAPLPLRHPQGYGNQQESVRAEIQTRTGSLAGRLLIGASAPAWFHARAVLVNAPGANQPFAKNSYRSVAEVKQLVPESITYLNVDTIWIDSTAAADPQLSDSFWQQVLLAGTTIAGHPTDIALLTKRLGLAANEPILLGRLVSADSPEAFTSSQGPISVVSNVPLEHIGSFNPFAFSVIVGKAMHAQLLSFSEFYLGIFLVLQTVVIVAGFLFLRGAARVWLWLIIPAFALIYTVAGITLAHLVIQSRSEGRLAQVELQVEGWPQGLLFTHLEQISLADHETVLDLPPDSFPFNPHSADDYYASNVNATFSFYHSADPTRLTVHAQPATRFAADVRSFIDAQPPCDLDGNGTLSILRPFSGAWVWDGASWHNLGPLSRGQKINISLQPIINPHTEMSGRYCLEGQEEDDFPSTLKPLLDRDTLSALSSAGQNLFLGVEPVANVKLENSADDHVESRRVVAYQFHSSGGAP